MQKNNNIKIIKDCDILMTDNDNIGKSLSEVIGEQTDEINKLKSNVKYIYTHGGVGGGMGGSGNGSGSSTSWDVLVTLGGTTLTDGGSVIFTEPGTYKLYVKVLRASGGTYSVKCKSECGATEDAKSSQSNSFDKLYQFETNLNLSTNNKYVSIIVEDDMGDMKVIKCMYIVKPIDSYFKIFKGGDTVEESLNGGMLLLKGEGIKSGRDGHSDSPYIEFWYQIGVPITNLEMTFNFGNFLSTNDVESAYGTTEDDKYFFDKTLYEFTPNSKNGTLKLVMDKNNLQQNGYVRLYVNDIKSALGDGAGYGILNPRNSNMYKISVNFNAVSSIGTMTSNLDVSFTAVPESIFMVVGDTSDTTHYFSEADVKTTNDNGDILASNDSVWTKKDAVTTKFIYNALTVGDGIVSNVKVFENTLSDPRNNYRVTWTLTPCCVNFDSTNDKMMLSKETFKSRYLASKTSDSSSLDADIEVLYELYTKKFYDNFLNNFDNLIWLDGKQHVTSFTFTYTEGEKTTQGTVKNFSITESHEFDADDTIRTETVTVTEQNYKQISISTIQTLGLNRVSWKVWGVKDTSASKEIIYYFYVKAKPTSVNWLLENIYNDTVITSPSAESYRLSSHHLNLDPDKDGAVLPPYKKNINVSGYTQNVNNFGSTVTSIQTRTTRKTNVVITPTNVGYTSSTTNFDTIVSFSMRYSDLNNDDTPILRINYNSGQTRILRKNYMFGEDNKMCIPSDDITDTKKRHLIQFVRHSIWSNSACGNNSSRYIDVLYIDGVMDNSTTERIEGPMRIDSIELLPCDVDYDLIDIEYYKPLIVRKDDITVKVLNSYDKTTGVVTTVDGKKSEDRDILDMFMYNYWVRYNTSYNGVEFDNSFDQVLCNSGSTLSGIVFDGGHIKISNSDILGNIAKNTAIPTLVLSVGYAQSNDEEKGYLMDRIQVEGSGNGSTAIKEFGKVYLDDILWSCGNGDSLNSQMIYASPTDDWETPKFYFELQGSSTVNNRAKNLSLCIESPSDSEKKTVLFSPNYDATDTSTFYPEQMWTLKTDVADSAHANNTSIGKFVNAVTEKPYRGSGKDNFGHLKNCLEGIPMMVFIKTNANTALEEINYLGLFNFNLGRNSHYNLGYNTATNTQEMISSISSHEFNLGGEKPFSYAFVDNMVFESGLVVGEISGNSPRFDFSQWNTNLVLDPADDDGSPYMFGDIVNYTNAVTLVSMVKQVSLAGRYIFRQLGRHFNDGWNDTETSKEGYRTYDANKNTYVNGFTKQYYYQDNKWVDDSVQDTNIGSADDVYTLLTDRKHEPYDNETLDMVLNYTTIAGTPPVNVTGPILDFTSLSEYYTICVAFGMVDSVLKNLNIKSWNGRTCYCQFYDMDCANGENNNGQEVIDYNVAMDYWQCVEKNGYVDGIDIQFDYWPASGSTDTEGNVINTVGFDFPSHYLFAVAKYGRQIMKSIDNNTTGVQKTQKYPQQFWAMLRGIPNETELNKDGQIKYGKAHGELRSADYFVDKYFNSGLGSMSKLFVNYNYNYKYFYRDGIYNKSTFNNRTYVGKIDSFHGTREYKVKEWLNNRFHFLDAMFQLDGYKLDAGKTTSNEYTTIEQYNNLVGGVTPGWVYTNFNLDSYTTYNSETIPTYMTKDNTFYVNDDDITGNEDIYIQNSAFHNRGEDPRQIGQGQHVVSFRCKPNTLFTLVNGEDTTRYMLTKDASEIQRLKVDLGGAKVLKLFGSKEIVYMENIDTFLRTNTLVDSEKLTQIIATEESPVSSFTINAPMCTTIRLNKSSYQGTLEFKEYRSYTSDSQEIKKTALENMKLLQELDISNSGLTCVSDTVYFDGGNKCTLNTLKINGVQSTNGIIKVTDMPNLTSINMSGSSSSRPTKLNVLDINCIRQNVTLNNTQINTIRLSVADDYKNSDLEFTINSDTAVETLELVGFKKVTINTCQNLKNLIIRDNNDAQDRHKLTDITINNSSSTANTFSSVLNISEDSSKKKENVYDLSHLVNLQKIEFNRCDNMVTLVLPDHVIDMTDSTNGFYYNTGLKYIDGKKDGNGNVLGKYGIFIDNVITDGVETKSRFDYMFYCCPIQMVESNGNNGSSNILSNIYLGQHITHANNTWSWYGSFSLPMYKYILDNMFKDRYEYHGFTYNSDGSIATKPYVTKVDGDFRSVMTNLNSCFYYKGFGYTVNQAEKDYKTCNAISTSDINSSYTSYKKRNLTTGVAETFTVGNTTDTAISDKNTTQVINGTNLVRPYMEAYVNLSGDSIWPNYNDSMFNGGYEQLEQIKSSTIIYTKGLLSYGSNVGGVGGFVAYGNRSQTSSKVIINLMLDTYANIGTKMSSFYLNGETNFYPTMRFWRYDSSLKQLILIPNTETITMSTFFNTLSNITSLSSVNFDSSQVFNLSGAFNSLTKLSSVINLCYYNNLSNIRNIDGLFANCPLKTCERIFTEEITWNDESASPLGTSSGTNTGNQTHYPGGRINIATFFKYNTPGIRYLLNGDTNKQSEVCMPIPRYVTYSDFITIWNNLTSGSSTTLESVDNLFANTVILMPNGSYEFNTNSPYEVSCKTDYYLKLGTSTTLFTKLSTARHLFDNFEMWYVKNYTSGAAASTALSGFNNNSIQYIGQDGNTNLGPSATTTYKCKLPIFLMTRTFTSVLDSNNKVIARDEENAFLHKLRYVKNYAFAFRNFYFYKMLSYDFFSKRQKYADARYINPLYYYYEVPDTYSKPVDGQQKTSDAIYYKLQDGNLSVITDDNYDGKRYQWADATVLSYNYFGNPDGSTTQNKITSLFRCFERTKFYSSVVMLDDSVSSKHPSSFTFVAGTNAEYESFNSPDVQNFDSGIYKGDRMLTSNDFKVTYDYGDGITRTGTFSTPYSRGVNTNPHRLYGNKGANVYSNISNMDNFFVGYDVNAGILGPNGYDSLDSFYVKDGSTTPYVIREVANDTYGDVFKIDTNKKSFTVKPTLVDTAKTLSNAYHVFNRDDKNNGLTNTFYYLPLDSATTLSGRFKEKATSYLSGAFKTERSKIGIKYAMYNWDGATRLYSDISRDNIIGDVVSVSTPINVNGTLHKFYSYPSISYRFVEVTNPESDMWYVSNKENIAVTNSYTHSGVDTGSVKYTWGVTINSNTQEYSGTVNIDDNFDRDVYINYMSNEELESTVKRDALTDLNSGYASFISGSASSIDMSIESLSDYKGRKVDTETATTNRKNGSISKHFYIDENTVLTYSGDSFYADYINYYSSTYGYTWNSGLNAIQNRRRWALKLSTIALSGYTSTEDGDYIGGRYVVSIESDAAKTDYRNIVGSGNFVDNHNEDFVDVTLNNSTCHQNYIKYSKYRYGHDNYSDNGYLSSAITYEGVVFNMPNVKIGKYYKDVRQTLDGYNLNTVKINGGTILLQNCVYDVQNGYVVYAQSPDDLLDVEFVSGGTEDEPIMSKKYYKITSTYFYVNGGNRGFKLSNGNIIWLVNAGISKKFKKTQVSEGADVWSGADVTLSSDSVTVDNDSYNINTFVGAKYSFDDYSSSQISCYGPRISGTDFVFQENGTAYTKTRITKDDLFKKKIIAYSTTVNTSDMCWSATDYNKLTTNNSEKLDIPVRYSREFYYYATYVYEKYSYAKVANIVKDSSYMDDVTAHIQLFGTTTNNNDNVIFGVPKYELKYPNYKDGDTLDDGDTKDTLKVSGNILYKIVSHQIWNYPTTNKTVTYTKNGETEELSIDKEGGYYLCPPDLLRGCSTNGCDLRYLFSYSNVVGALHKNLLKNMSNVSISNWLRNVDVLPQYIGHNTHVKQYSFIPSGFNLSGDLTQAFNFRYRLPKSYNPSTDTGNAGDETAFNNNSEYFICLKDSFNLSGNYINVSSLKYAFTGSIYDGGGLYRSDDGGSQWGNSDTLYYDYQPLRYTYTEEDKSTIGYNCHFYLCGTKGANCYVPKGIPITLTGKTVKLDNMITDIAPFFMGPVLDDNVHGEDVTNSCFDANSGTCIINKYGALLHPSVQLPKYLINPAQTAGKDKNNYGRIVWMYGSADPNRSDLNNGYNYVSIGTLGGRTSAAAYHDCGLPGRSDGTGTVMRVTYYEDRDLALKEGRRYNLKDADNDTADSSGVEPDSFYKTCHT